MSTRPRLVLTLEGDQAALERVLHSLLAAAAQAECAHEHACFSVVAADWPGGAYRDTRFVIVEVAKELD